MYINYLNINDKYNNIKLKNEDKFEENLLCNLNERNIYLDKIKNNKDIILSNFKKYIYSYIKNDRNIFDNKIRFSKNSMLENEDIYIALKIKYTMYYINIEIIILNELPLVMKNKDIFFNFYTIIKRKKKKFNLIAYQMKGMFENNLYEIIYDIFEKTFIEMNDI